MFKFARYVLGVGLMVGTTAASAGEVMSDAAGGVMNACRPDYHRLCSYAVQGNGRIARCLLDHETELTPSCLRAVKIAAGAEACMADYRRYCQGVPRGQQAFECLAGRMDALRPACRRVVSANAPYMQPHGERYGYGRGPGPYGGPNYDAYAFRYGSPDEERYAREGEPGVRRYGGYGDRQRDEDRDLDEGNPSPQDRYAEEEAPRFQPYGGRYAGPGYPGQGYGYGGPPSRYGPDEEREPAR